MSDLLSCTSQSPWICGRSRFCFQITYAPAALLDVALTSKHLPLMLRSPWLNAFGMTNTIRRNLPYRTTVGKRSRHAESAHDTMLEKLKSAFLHCLYLKLICCALLAFRSSLLRLSLSFSLRNQVFFGHVCANLLEMINT